MSGSRFLKLKTAFLTALILLGAGKALPGMGAEPLKNEVIPSPSLAMAALREEPRRVVINIPSRTLWVYSGDAIVRYFPVGVGRVGYMTPVGKFSIIRKVIDPGWENPYLPTGKVRLAPGEDNPLGTRWMGFYQKDGGEYGLHGTDNPDSVGRFSSHGCVRMRVADAEALFDMVEVGTPVEVVYQPVLIRRQGNHVRVIVYADRFKRGMPSLNKVKADIAKQYPDAKINIDKLKAALTVPVERPMDVGAIVPTTDVANETVPTKTGPMEAPVSTSVTLPVPAENVPVRQAPRIEPETTPVRVGTPESSGHGDHRSTKTGSRPAVKDSELPLNPRTLFN